MYMSHHTNVLPSLPLTSDNTAIYPNSLASYDHAAITTTSVAPPAFQSNCQLPPIVMPGASVRPVETMIPQSMPDAVFYDDDHAPLARRSSSESWQPRKRSSVHEAIIVKTKLEEDLAREVDDEPMPTAYHTPPRQLVTAEAVLRCAEEEIGDDKPFSSYPSFLSMKNLHKQDRRKLLSMARRDMTIPAIDSPAASASPMSTPPPSATSPSPPLYTSSASLASATAANSVSVVATSASAAMIMPPLPQPSSTTALPTLTSLHPLQQPPHSLSAASVAPILPPASSAAWSPPLPTITTTTKPANGINDALPPPPLTHEDTEMQVDTMYDLNMASSSASPPLDDARGANSFYNAPHQPQPHQQERLKRPPNAYLLFNREMRSKLLAYDPKMTVAQISKQIGDRWKSLDPDERNKYQEAALALKQDHLKNHPDFIYTRRSKAQLEEARRMSRSNRKTSLQPSSSSSSSSMIPTDRISLTDDTSHHASALTTPITMSAQLLRHDASAPSPHQQHPFAFPPTSRSSQHPMAPHTMPSAMPTSSSTPLTMPSSSSSHTMPPMSSSSLPLPLSAPTTSTSTPATTAPAPARKRRGRQKLEEGQRDPRGRKKKRHKYPSAPKHPMSGFLFFLGAIRPQVAQQFPGSTVGPISKEISSRWKRMTPEERAPWLKKAEDDKARYAREIQEYMANVKKQEQQQQEQQQLLQQQQQQQQLLQQSSSAPQPPPPVASSSTSFHPLALAAPPMLRRPAATHPHNHHEHHNNGDDDQAIAKVAQMINCDKIVFSK
ncbi:hypothetical protein BC940DRAFT_301094 [Gongronella butleri]|nr:hypothetical protein BC940DRAFT_301094 [Gongronella butleri]